MIGHAAVFYYIAVIIVGTFTLSLSIAGTIRSRLSSYRLLIGFYAFFTAMICLEFIRDYLSINIGMVTPRTEYLFDAINSVIYLAFMAFVSLYFSHVFLTAARKTVVIAIVVFNLCLLAMLFIPGSFTLDVQSGAVLLSPVGRVWSILSDLQFLFLILLGSLGSKKDRTPRELTLIWSLVLFAAVGFAENTIGILSSFSLDLPSFLSPGKRAFLISSIPYLAFSGVLIYYFGTYIAADLGREGIRAADLSERFGLSQRETEVIPFIVKGMNNREIAEKLFIGTATVKTHLHNIYQKTGAKSRYELIHLLQTTKSTA